MAHDELDRLSRERKRRGKAPPTNLPVLREQLVGRDRDLASARQILLTDTVGLLTLTGAGGSGKTSLALHLATDVLDSFDDGAFFVSCAPLADPGLVASTIAQTLGLRDAGDRPVLESLLDHLQRRSLLLILDNFEQLLPAAPLVADLLAASPGLKVLVTSRAALKVRGEHEVHVPPLALPDLHLLPGRELLAHNPAVALFVGRARAVRSSFALTDENAQTVAEIAVRLDGLPLAIELAAARLRLFSPRELLARLDHRLPLLTGGARDVPARQRTLRGAIAWSYDLLDAAEQRLFRQLAVFVGGCTLDAAERIAVGGIDPDGHPAASPSRAGISFDSQAPAEREYRSAERHRTGPTPTTGQAILDGIAALVDMNLVRHEDGGADESRLGMLETIREYGLEQLDASGEAATVQQRHAAYFVRLAESADVTPWGTAGGTWLNRLEREHDNIRAALAWNPEAAEGGDLSARLAAAMSYFWYLHGHFAEGRRWIQGVLATDTASAGAIRAPLLAGLGLLEHQAGEYRQTEAHLHESLTLYQQLGDQRGMAWTMILLGNVAYHEGRLEESGTLFEVSLAEAHASGDPWLIAVGHYRLGSLADSRGELDLAVSHLESTVAALRAIDEHTLRGRALARLGIVVNARGDHVRARHLLEESQAIARAIGDALGEVQGLFSLGWVMHARGEEERATDCFRQSLALARLAGVRWSVAHAIHSLGQVAQASGDLVRAARLFGAAEALHARIDRTLPVGGAAEHQRNLTVLRSNLGDAVVDALLDEGRAMTWESACDFAMADVDRAERPVFGPADRRPSRGPSELTLRELEIVALIARGWTNRQIAKELGFTERTAETHARNIREKVGLATRAELVAWANGRGGLVDAH